MAKKESRTILVTGATGHQGSAALRHLREKGFTVRALTRDPTKDAARLLVGPRTEVIGGDLNDRASVARALDGVQGVYSVQSSMEQGVEAEVRQGILLADEAKRNDVRHFVYSSVGSADRNTGIPHFDSKYKIEEHIRTTGMRYTILRPTFFMENWLGMRDQINQGTLALPLAPETRLQMVSVDDIGAFVAMAFDRPGHWEGRRVELAGDELTMTELTKVFSRMAGREVSYEQTPWDEFEKKVGPELATMYRWFQDVGYQADIPSLRHEYWKLTSFERWVHANWQRQMTA
jgi:uncharacterized protein YbjT (DUF2867 family)